MSIFEGNISRNSRDTEDKMVGAEIDEVYQMKA